MAAGYLTRYTTHGLLSLMTGAGDDPILGVDPIASKLAKAYAARLATSPFEPTYGNVPKEVLLAFLDQVDARGAAALRTEVSAWSNSNGTFYLALTSAEPGRLAASLPSEVAAAGYMRQVVGFSAARDDDGNFALEAGTPSLITQASAAVFGPFTAPTGSGVPVTHMALVTDSTGTSTSVLAVWPLDTPVTASQGDSLLASAGSLTIKVD